MEGDEGLWGDGVGARQKQSEAWRSKGRSSTQSVVAREVTEWIKLLTHKLKDWELVSLEHM